MSSIRLLLLLGILSLSFESSCRINQQQGECSYIGECEGTQILSECGDGYGCCLSKSLNLLEEYKDFGLFSTIWGKIKNWFSKFKIDIHIDIHINIHIERSFMSGNKGLTSQQVNVLNKIQKILNSDTTRNQKIAIIDKLISDVDKTIKINPNFAKDRVIEKIGNQNENPLEGLKIKIQFPQNPTTIQREPRPMTQ